MHISAKKKKKVGFISDRVVTWTYKGCGRWSQGNAAAMGRCCHLCQLSVLLPGGHRACHWWQKGNCYGLQLMNEFKLPI